MSRASLTERIKQGLFLLDGAMGTELIARGVEAGRCYDYLNIDTPELVADVHQAYLNTGSHAVLTNTFGGNKYALARHDFGDVVEKINTEGARIARRTAGDDSNAVDSIDGPQKSHLRGRICRRAKRVFALHQGADRGREAKAGHRQMLSFGADSRCTQVCR